MANVSLRCNARFLSRLDRLAAALRLPKKGHRSKIIRRAVENQMDLWAKFPYVAETATHFAYVDPYGSLYYRPAERLYFNRHVQSIPASLRIKHDMLPGEHMPEWELNHFALRKAEHERPEAHATDNKGYTRKRVRLHQACRSREKWHRDGCFIIRSYMRGVSSDSPGSGRVDVFTELPTRMLRIVVLVDADYFSPSTVPARLQGQLRTLEEVKLADFQDHSSSLTDNIVDKISGHYSPGDDVLGDKGYRNAIREARSLFAGMRTELLRLDEKRYSGLALPDAYYFYSMAVRNPTLGLAYSIFWEQP